VRPSKDFRMIGDAGERVGEIVLRIEADNRVVIPSRILTSQPAPNRDRRHRAARTDVLVIKNGNP
jgi:hypothetical protein